MTTKKAPLPDETPTIMVVGFVFTPALDQVILIRKTHPAWQAGKYNGLGGHVRLGEPPLEAMAREFKEESGIAIPTSDWKEYARMEGENPEGEKWVLHIFCATYASCETAESRTPENVSVQPTSIAGTSESLANLSWLVPLAIDSMQSKFPCKVRARIQGSL
jgi:8-oxo-dGTP pyrophosphatase MutT (NUDIX family)